MLQLLLTLIAGVGGYLLARNFVRRRLRFVDAIHAPWFPAAAAVVAFAVAWPLTLLPLVTAASAVCFGLGTGLGSAAGARQVRRKESARRLPP